TGGLARREQCPWVPYTPAEIAEEARRAWEAGAAVVHIHARTDDGAPTYEPHVYAAIRREIESRCPVILNFSTGGLGPMEGRVAHVREVKPAIAENLAAQAREAQALSRKPAWEVIGISHEQWTMIAAALALGGNVRVGLEDNFYLDAAGTQMARSNGDLVAKAARMARDAGREPATVQEARALLSLGEI